MGLSDVLLRLIVPDRIAGPVEAVAIHIHAVVIIPNQLLVLCKILQRRLRPVWRTTLVSSTSRVVSQGPVMTASRISAVATIESDGKSYRS